MYKGLSMIFSVAVIALGLGAVVARADFCGHYANRATMQQDMNLAKKCGFKGSKWSKDHRGHYNWCKKVPKREAEQEVRLREAALDRCKRGESSRDRKRERDRGRGLPRTRQPERIRREGREGRREGREGRRQRRDGRRDRRERRREGWCRDYARRSVEQYRESRYLRCRFYSSAWTDDGQAHFDWCTRVDRGRSERALRQRDDELRRCRYYQRGGPGDYYQRPEDYGPRDYYRRGPDD